MKLAEATRRILRLSEDFPAEVSGDLVSTLVGPLFIVIPEG
jgi:hypothetical protein